MASFIDLLPDRVAGTLAYRNARTHPEHEERDACGGYVVLPEHQEDVLDVSALRVGEAVPHGGKVLKEIPGMGRIIDWRPSPWTPVNGGKIRPLVAVQHIPVIRNMAGLDDFIVLRNVLVAQGLMVQSATDAAGNVALYTPLDRLCYQAKGANQVSCGVEHMHANITESWSKQQLRAVAWLALHTEHQVGIPSGKGSLGSGAGVVRVLKRGSVTHQGVSDAAGFHDRSDPGAGLWGHWDEVQHHVRYLKAHGDMAHS